jgi:hypothetical protein
MAPRQVLGTVVLDAAEPRQRAAQIGAGMWTVMSSARADGTIPSGVLQVDVVEGRGPCTCAVNHLWLRLAIIEPSGRVTGCAHLLAHDSATPIAATGATNLELAWACAVAALFSAAGAWAAEQRRPPGIVFQDLSHNLTAAFAAKGVN